MRNHYTIALAMLALSATAAQAQITKGKIILGPEFALSSSKSQTGSFETKGNSYSVGALVGTAIRNNQVLGANVGYQWGKTKGDPTVNATSSSEYNTLRLGLFYRYYQPLGGRFYLFGQADANANIFRQEQTIDIVTFPSTARRYVKDRGWGLNLGLSPAVAFQVAKRFHMELSLPPVVSLGYGHLKTEESQPQTPTTNTESNSFGFQSSFNGNFLAGSSLGFRFWL